MTKKYHLRRQGPDGLLFNSSKADWHRGRDPFRKSTFTKEFDDDLFVNKIVRTAFQYAIDNELLEYKDSKIEFLCIRGGKELVVGAQHHQTTNGQNGAPCTAIRVAFKKESATATSEVWVTTSIYPIPKVNMAQRFERLKYKL